MYFGTGWGGGWGKERGRVGEEGGWLLGTSLLINVYGFTEVTWAMTACIGPPTAGQLWQLWQLTWAVTGNWWHYWITKWSGSIWC